MPDPEIVLHHYASSPYSEKVRLALGIKGLAWRSVEIAAVPPRPLLDPLTGGYRRVPVLQVGADVYCDTHAILPALERLRPEPSLYPGLPAGLCEALAFGFERDIWLSAISVRVHFAGDGPEDFLRDRREDYLYVDMSRAAMEPAYPRNLQRVAAGVAWLAQTLSDGRRFLCGDRAGAVDLGFFHPLWLARNGEHAAQADAALGFAPIRGWYERVAGLGHGRPEPMPAEAALAAAKAAAPAAITQADAASRMAGFEPDQAVTVTPDDFARVPVRGRLVAFDTDRIVLRRDDPQVGALHLHFPRAGFEVTPG